MKKQLLLFLVGIIFVSMFSVISTKASTGETGIGNQRICYEEISKTEIKLQQYVNIQILKNIVNSKLEEIEKNNFLFESFGEYNGYEVCYACYEFQQPWEPWARVGNYAFRLLFENEGDRQLMGLYLIKGDEILRLEDVADNGADLDEIVALITSTEKYRRYFNVFRIIEQEVGSIGDVTVRYEGITREEFKNSESTDIGQEIFSIGNYTVCAYGVMSFYGSENTRGLYATDKTGEVFKLDAAYKRELLGTDEQILTVLTENEFSGKNYWSIKEKETQPQPTTVTEPTTASTTLNLVKAKQPIKVTTTIKTVKASKLKAKKQTVKNAITVKNNKGSVAYSKVKSGSSAKLSINSKTGKITINKGTKAGTYKIKVKVTAKGNSTYNKGSKTVTVRIKVK